MKKIVFMIKDFFNAGLERRVSNLANELANRGYLVTILVTHGVAEKTIFQLHPNVSIMKVDESKKQFLKKAPMLANETNLGEKEKDDTNKKYRKPGSSQPNNNGSRNGLKKR